MKRYRISALLPAAVMAAFAAVALVTLPACSDANGDAPEDTAETDEADDFVIEAFGTVKAVKTRTLAIEFPAVIEAIHVSLGQLVSRGTGLITLDTHSYRNQQSALRSKIEIAKLRLAQISSDYKKSDVSTSSEYRRVKNSISSAQQEIDQLRSEYNELRRKVTSGEDPEMKKLIVDLEQSRKELKAAETELSTKNELYKDGSILETEFEREQNAVEALRSRTTNLELSIESLKDHQRQELSRLQLAITQKSISVDNMTIQLEQLAGPEATNIRIQEAQIAAYEQELEQLLSRSQFPYIDGTMLVSDVENGIIQEISGTEGEVVATGVALIKIIDLDSLVVEAGVPEEFIKEIDLESEAKIKPLADTDRSYTGRVSRISGMAVSRNGETVVDVELEIINHDGFLIPNFNVDIEFTPKPETQDAANEEGAAAGAAASAAATEAANGETP